MGHTPGARRARASRPGFTLIELVVVLLLLSIAAAATAPALARFTEEDPLADGAERVGHLLRRARLTAVERGRTVVVAIVPEEARYRAWIAGEAAPLAEGGLELDDGLRIESAAPRPTFVFTARGGASADRVVVREEGRAATVEVDPWTGAVRVRVP